MDRRGNVNKTHTSTKPKGSAASIGKAVKPTVKSLISNLASDDGVVRVKARRQLVAYKARVVAPLMRALSDNHHWKLCQIGNLTFVDSRLRA